jgi:hypothetical protein
MPCGETCYRILSQEKNTAMSLRKAARHFDFIFFFPFYLFTFLSSSSFFFFLFNSLLYVVPWCIRGDFNATRFPSERLGNHRYAPSMEEFSRFIFDHGLMDIPLRGGQFTWSNGTSWSRIDRFLLSSGWEERFANVAQRRLTRVMSDHFPIILEGGVPNRVGGYFKFENMWLKFEGFVEQVNLWWQSYQFNGDPSYVLACILRALKGDLRRWNNEIFGHVGKRKKALLEEMRELDSLQEERGLDEEEKRKKMLLTMEMERNLLCEEISWRQKS